MHRLRAGSKHSSSLRHGGRLVTDPVEDQCATQVPGFRSPTPQALDTSNVPQPPEQALTDLAGRRRFAGFLRMAGTLLDPDPERYDNSQFRGGRYRSYPRTPGEEYLNPLLREQEEKFYLARSGRSPSQLSLREPQASGSSSQTPKSDEMRHGRSYSGASQLLEVPRRNYRPMMQLVPRASGSGSGSGTPLDNTSPSPPQIKFS